jgi:hypothetical protein
MIYEEGGPFFKGANRLNEISSDVLHFQCKPKIACSGFALIMKFSSPRARYGENRVQS